MRENQKHIIKTLYSAQAVSGVAYCGAEVSMGFAFLDAEHAFNTMKRRDRLLPCPKCWREIGKNGI